MTKPVKLHSVIHRLFATRQGSSQFCPIRYSAPGGRIISLPDPATCFPWLEQFQKCHLQAHKPRHSKWSRHIAPYDLVTSLQSKDRLREAARTILTSVSTLGMHCDIADCVASSAHLPLVLESAGSSLEVLPLGCISSSDVEPTVPWINTLATNRAVLHQLDISYLTDSALVEAILTALHGRVRSLSIDRDYTHLVTAHCVGLVQLDLFSLPQRGLCDMWRAIGSTLELLFIDENVRVTEVRNIQHLCRKLEVVCIEIAEGAERAYTNLLVSYGDQLKRTNVYSLSEAQIQRVIASCRNVRWDVFLHSFADNIMPLRSMGNRIDMLDMSLHNDDTPSKLRKAVSGCNGMKEIFLLTFNDSVGIRALEALDLGSKLSLAHLSLMFPWDSPMEDAFRIVAQGTGALRSLK